MNNSLIIGTSVTRTWAKKQHKFSKNYLKSSYNSYWRQLAFLTSLLSLQRSLWNENQFVNHVNLLMFTTQSEIKYLATKELLSCHYRIVITRKALISKQLKRSLNIWGTFARKFVGQNFKNLPHLVTLLGTCVCKHICKQVKPVLPVRSPAGTAGSRTTRRTSDRG